MSKKPDKLNKLGKIPIDLRAIKRALFEDAPSGDITTTATVPANAGCEARLVAKQDFTLAGIDLFKAVFLAKDSGVKVVKHFADGESVPKGAVIATISGKARAILTAERVALNYLQRLSAVATLTCKFVKAVEGTRAVILDTRKTVPGYRDLDKYAVRCGGGQNHRHSLSDMALIKENHIAVAGGIKSAVNRVRKKVGSEAMIEVEAGSWTQIAQALEAGAGRIMLDNMKPAQVKKAVKLIEEGAQTESSGNISLKNVKAYAKTGVDYISVGALTHSPTAVDVSLLIDIRTEEVS
ncbi:Quinolinate phosphoribosyltransferase [decarboxylating] [hydrothermal vent metagenome]|uniref:Probable nicotinate-nucleotide pyrophosphorylase [carboxylating] n=1 Tax=hydrothermal vent metagenome TaxID=652676 RepID=A0A3B1D395_9ZZZZ